MSPLVYAPRRWSVVIAGLLGVLTPSALLFEALPQSSTQDQNLHSVLSHVILTPPLRSPEVVLRYSPDGNYLLLQDPAGIAVLSRTPLRLLFHVTTDSVYPAQFSADSQSLVVVASSLNFAKWRLPDGKKTVQGELPAQTRCLDGQLAPGGELFACSQPGLRFALYELSSGKSVFEQSLPSPQPFGPGGLRPLYPVVTVFFSSLDIDSAFPGPFGLVRTSEPRPSPGRPLFATGIHFSPDAKTLIAPQPSGFFGLDLEAKKPFDLPGSLFKPMHEPIALQSGERLIAVANEKGKPEGGGATVFSARNGNVLGTLRFTASRLEFASSLRYLVLYNHQPDGQTAAAFDLDQNRSVETPPALGLDIHGDELAVYTANGSLAFYQLGERNLLASLQLPLPALPLLRSAAVTPNLDALAFSVDGSGAIFDLSNGHRRSSLPKFTAVNFSDEQGASLLFPTFHQDAPHVSRLHFAASQAPLTHLAGNLSLSWEGGKEPHLRAGGPVILEYFYDPQDLGRAGDLPVGGVPVPYHLRALDPATGRELWKREFSSNAPVPFADPQGQRLVLGWRANTSQGKSAANHNPAARAALKAAKLTDHDSYFEVLEARTGESLGGTLVTVGNGATTFDAAFSVGDALILLKDGLRVSLYSLRDGQLKGRLVGLRPAASPETQLLALDLGDGRLGIFDLRDGAKLDQQVFPNGLAYLHFSSDGKRLVVLTEQQTAVILDLTDVRHAPSLPAQANDHNK